MDMRYKKIHAYLHDSIILRNESLKG